MAPNSAPDTVKVLVVDDEPAMRDLYGEMLPMRSNIEVVDTAEDGARALEIIQADSTHRIDAIVSDYEMPRMDGLEMTKEVRQIRPNIYIVIISGRAEDAGFTGVLARQPDAQPDAIFSKPVNIGEVRQTIEDALGTGA